MSKTLTTLPKKTINFKNFTIIFDNYTEVYNGEISIKQQKIKDDFVDTYDVKQMKYSIISDQTRDYILTNYTSAITYPKSGRFTKKSVSTEVLGLKIAQTLSSSTADSYICFHKIPQLCEYGELNTSSTPEDFIKVSQGTLTQEVNKKIFSVKFESKLNFDEYNLLSFDTPLKTPTTAQINIEDTFNSKNAITIKDSTDSKALISAFANGTAVTGYPKTVDWTYFN